MKSHGEQKKLPRLVPSDGQRLTGLFGFALLCLLVLSSTVIRVSLSTRDLTDRILTNRSASELIEKILTQISEVESMKRGYATSGDPAFLTHLQNFKTISKDIAELKLLTLDPKDLQESIRDFSQAVTLKLAFSKHIIDLTAKNGPAYAQKEISKKEGLKIMEDVDRKANELLNRQRVELNSELAKRNNNLQELILFSSSLSLFAFLGLFFSFFKIRSHLTQLQIQKQISEKTKQEMENIINTVRDPILILEGDLRVKGASRSFYETFRVSPEASKNKFVYELREREWDIPQFRALLGETLSSKGEVKDFEVMNVFPDLGKKTWLVSARQLSSEIPGVPNILVSLKDITERTTAENILKATNLELVELRDELEKRVSQRTEELKKSEEFLKQAIRVGGFGLFDHDQINEKIYWSEEQRKILGFEARETYQFSDFTSRVHSEDLENVIAHVTEAHAPSGTGLFSIEHRIILPDGSIRWISHRAQTYFLGEGHNRKPVRTIGVTLDITESKQAEQIIQNALKRLAREKSKLEESNRDLERFAAIAAHDLRAPIRSVGLWIEMIEDLVPKPLSSELEQAIHFTKANSQKSLVLIEDLLEIAKVKPESSGWENISLNQMVDQILLTLKPDVDGSKAQIHVDPLPTVEGIVWQFHSVLSNLLRNALLYRDPSRTPEISISFKEKPSFYLFQVKDNGIGIAPEYQKRIFEMFERLHTEEEFPGTGIGLALCKKLVESWGGEMCVESKLGVGSSFYFTYPKKEQLLERKSA